MGLEEKWEWKANGSFSSPEMKTLRTLNNLRRITLTLGVLLQGAAPAKEMP
jgi:hypothetical protein